MSDNFGNNYGAVLFDMDGVLIDSMPFHVRAYNDVLSRYGISVSELEVAGRSTQETLTSLLGHQLSIHEIADLAKGKSMRSLQLMEAVGDQILIENAIKEMTTITGQQAVATLSKKDISNFKLRKGMPVGVRVTLRDNTMFEFLDRLVAVALPRICDFKGINDKGFDGRGNYTLGVTEQIIFPEINIDQINKIAGMDITFVTSAKTDVEALELLKQFGLPFKNQQANG